MHIALSPNAWLRWDLIRRQLAEDRPGRILEIGCGKGAVGQRLAEFGSYTAVELDDRSRAEAAHNIGPAGRVLASLDALDDSERFDLVCAFEVLEHIEDDRGALAKWVSLLAPGGTLMLSVPAHAERFGPADRWAGHFRRYERAQLEGLATECGLHDVEVKAWGFPLGYALEAARNRIAARDLSRDSTRQESVEERTAKSARLLQPPRWAGAATQVVTAPSRLLQRRLVTGERGTGWLLVAHA